MSLTEETTWLNEELKEVEQQKNIDQKPALKLEENKVTELDLIQGAAWAKWTDPQTGTLKKIIPVMHEGKEKVMFLNCANPVYKEIVTAAGKGQLHFKIMRTGQAKQTRYIIIK